MCITTTKVTKKVDKENITKIENLKKTISILDVHPVQQKGKAKPPARDSAKEK
jgi:hypothetical protein